MEQAKITARLPYSITVTQDEATDGTPILLVENDELKGCMAQGRTIEEALANLEEARIDYIYSLLEDGLDIPLPAEGFPPGEFIREELEERGWTQEDLAEILGHPRRLVNEIIMGKREITIETANGLGAAFGTSAQFWLNLDSAFRCGKLLIRQHKNGKHRFHLPTNQ